MTKIRRFGGADLAFALRQTSREGWAASREQFKLYLEHDPEGCFIAMEEDRPVGMVTTTCLSPSGWIANLIVEPDYRSRGIGRDLMVHGLEHLRERNATTVRLDGDPQGIPLYRALGFEDEHESCRFTLRESENPPTLDDSSAEKMSARDLDEVAALDAVSFGANRRRFLALKISVAEISVVRRRKGKIVAFLLASPTDRGLRIGPCSAASCDDARCLITAAVSAASGRPILIGLPALNTEALTMFSELGFEQAQSCLRMRLGPPIAAGDPTRVFAISSGAIG